MDDTATDAAPSPAPIVAAIHAFDVAARIEPAGVPWIGGDPLDLAAAAGMHVLPAIDTPSRHSGREAQKRGREREHQARTVKE
jgi:hypothetical protein